MYLWTNYEKTHFGISAKSTVIKKKSDWRGSQCFESIAMQGLERRRKNVTYCSYNINGVQELGENISLHILSLLPAV
jgi:hypothetical protein